MKRDKREERGRPQERIEGTREKKERKQMNEKKKTLMKQQAMQGMELSIGAKVKSQGDGRKRHKNKAWSRQPTFAKTIAKPMVKTEV